MQYFWRQSQKQKNRLCLFARQTIQYERIEVYAPNINAEDAEVEWFSEDLQDLLELTCKKKELSFSLKGTGMQK